MKKIAASMAPALVVLGMTAIALADTAPAGPQNLNELVAKINLVIDLAFTALIVFSVIFIIAAAFQFVTAGGDPNGVLQARSKLIYAAVGIIVALLAKSIPIVLRTFLGL